MTKRSKQKELLFQKHLIDSYKACGGYASKWATELAVGKPDLVACLPDFGVHLVEVKHRPDWTERVYKNPLNDKQINEARNYINGGGIALSMVVVGKGSKAIDSSVYIFSSLAKSVDLSWAMHVDYIAGKKFNVDALMRNRGFYT